MFRYISTAVLLCMQAYWPASGIAQACHYTVTGHVQDKQGGPVPGAVVYLLHTAQGTGAAIDGSYSISNVCAHDTLVCDAAGYKRFVLPLSIDSNCHLDILLGEGTELNEVVINGKRVNDLQTVASVTLQGLALLQTRGLTLGETLKELPGLNTMQTGPTLSKPVIHGMNSNRVLIINNDVRQEGQQWGTEHAPEIDPFIANKITVIKGAASVRYGSDAVGGVVLIDPDDLPDHQCLKGNVYVIGASNGRMGGLSSSLEGAFGKGLSGLSFRVQGTLRDAGNFQTPHYYLINTGIREGDFSANVAYKWKAINLNVYYSQFNNEIGIFTGAESGNLQELIEKFESGTPNTPSYFSYNIGRSYQTVYHDLLKATANYTFKNDSKLDLTFGRQKDLRQEYDADLPYNTNPELANEPQLSFQLITHTLDLIYTQHAANGFSGSAGMTGLTSGNVFKGILYLIPNYRDYNGGAFWIERYQYGKFTFEAGLRYDYRWLRVYQRNSTSLQLYNSTFNYNNVTGTAGTTYRYNEQFSISANIGRAWRAPSINELYVKGVHFSDNTYEIGDSALKSEQAINSTLSFNYTGNKLRAVIDLYDDIIGNYIYETPLSSPVTTISGTYPAFAFTQDNVTIKGVDADIQYDFAKHFTFQSKTTIVRGYNKTQHDYLIYMPADRFENGVQYSLPKIGKVASPYLSFDNISVLKQVRAPANGDYVPPPDGYSLFAVNTGCTMPIGKNTLDINFAIDNLTNVAYRDYLDHFRYYNDELGRNFILRLKYSF